LSNSPSTCSNTAAKNVARPDLLLHHDGHGARRAELRRLRTRRGTAIYDNVIKIWWPGVIAYGVLYTVGILALATVIFQQRNFK
jgi:hypothetical protein